MNDITFSDVVRIIWQQNKIILLFTFIGLLFSVLYLFCATPIYEARVILQAPSRADISSINKSRGYVEHSPLKTFSPKDIYSFYSSSLVSQVVQQRFFKEVYLASLGASSDTVGSKSYKSFLKNIVIKQQAENKYMLIARSSKPEKAEHLIKQYLVLAEQDARNNLSELIYEQDTSYTMALKHQIDELKVIIAESKASAQAYIKETVALMKSMGVNQPTLTVSTNNKLENRLHELEYNYQFFSHLNRSFNTIEMFRLDGTIMTTGSPISPKTHLDLILGLLSGLLFGSAIGLVRGLLLRNLL
jgi:chain length determinant protein (polysaccharide antigen chain regulator)